MIPGRCEWCGDHVMDHSTDKLRDCLLCLSDAILDGTLFDDEFGFAIDLVQPTRPLLTITPKESLL